MHHHHWLLIILTLGIVAIAVGVNRGNGSMPYPQQAPGSYVRPVATSPRLPLER